jgi:hypothetical protein
VSSGEARHQPRVRDLVGGCTLAGTSELVRRTVGAKLEREVEKRRNRRRLEPRSTREMSAY